PTEASPATLAAELKLIQAAREAPPSEALALLERHAEQFGAGELSNERESLRVIALCELDRRAEAQRASERFIARHPGALLIARVRTACANKISLPTTDLGGAGNGSP
ncbi:hypothetical protein, partial [Enhygromyxa salina]|uniref:hypothetical protein n=1 Tax=Enhygromyxa salina TaxID=215803 RepID=UPI0015E5EEF6